MSIRLNYTVGKAGKADPVQAAFSASQMEHAMINIGMRKNVPVNEVQGSFIGSMKGAMQIVGDIIAPIDVKWDADSTTPGDPLKGSTDR
jgi:hypothetical protein